MKAALVELGAEPVFGLGAKAQDRQLAELVSKGLSGPGDLTIDLCFDLMLSKGGVIGKIIDRLLARPAILMDSRIDHETGSAPHVVAELAELLRRRPVDAELVTEPFTVKPPSFTHP